QRFGDLQCALSEWRAIQRYQDGTFGTRKERRVLPRIQPALLLPCGGCAPDQDRHACPSEHSERGACFAWQARFPALVCRHHDHIRLTQRTGLRDARPWVGDVQQQVGLIALRPQLIYYTVEIGIGLVQSFHLLLLLVPTPLGPRQRRRHSTDDQDLRMEGVCELAGWGQSCLGEACAIKWDDDTRKHLLTPFLVVEASNSPRLTPRSCVFLITIRSLNRDAFSRGHHSAPTT